MSNEEMDVHYEEHGKSDLTLTSSTDLFYVHQNVVCAQSPVLKNKCAALKKACGQAHEHTSLLSRFAKMAIFWDHKPKTIEINITGDDVAVEAMVHFFYHGNYLPDNYDADTAKFDKDAGFHVAVMMMAKAYEVKELEALAQGLMEKAFDNGADRGEHVDLQITSEDGGLRMV